MAKKEKKQRPEFNLNAVLGDPNLKTQVRGFVEEIGKLKEAQKSAGDAIKGIKTEAHDSIGIPGKILNNLVKEWLAEGTIDGEIHMLDEAKVLSDAIKK